MAVDNKTKKSIMWEIWALQQDNLRRGDILDRAHDPEFRKSVMENMRQAEKRIAELKAKL